MGLQSFQEILHADNVKGVIERQWNRKKSYVMKWKQSENLHILLTV